jgi:hypothetical protein
MTRLGKSWVLGALLVVGCGLSPKPGARLVLEGDLETIQEPPFEGAPPLTNDADRFYWGSRQGLVSRPIAGGVTTKLAEIGTVIDAPAVTRDDVVMWDESGRILEIVPKRGGDVRRIPLGKRLDPGAIVAVADGVLWPEHQGGDIVVSYLPTREAGATPREVGRIAGESDVRLETSSEAYVVWTFTGVESRIYGAEHVGAPLRRLYSVPRDEAAKDVSLTVQVGTRHAYVMRPKGALWTTPVPLVALPLDGTPSRVIAPRACAWSLAVLGDDPLYVRPRERCPGEFPETQKLDVMRYEASGAHLVYSVYGGSVDLRAAGGRGVVIRERIPLEHRSGSPPAYENRTALLTLR